ncbi:hypothetical protein [Secundilactobacillus kimchicus]|uniref:hypothetical protein n=1 Tax=Secundilactobacillus kimchicus TaxID=528209 RepID=UPI0024A7C749|nr:hypothetical protein [Secundilactobacillus kimchicus]
MAFAGIAGATSASAKSYAKVTSIGSFKGNVVATGSNAVTTKAATLQGAKTVKSASALKTAQDADKTGNYNFRAYSVATTNRGSVYYKVVSFDKTVRGWVYGGKVKGTVAGGIKDFATTTDATAPTGDQTAKDGAQLWNAPAWTTYKVGRASEKLANGAKFTVSKAVTNSKSGDVYYQIAGTKTAADGKWIAAKDVTTNNAIKATDDNSVYVNYINDKGVSVGTATFTTTLNTTRKGDVVSTTNHATNIDGKNLNDFINSSAPKGYSVSNLPTLTNVKFGDTVVANVKTAATSKISLRVGALDSSVDTKDYTVGNSISASDVNVPTNNSSLSTLKGHLQGDPSDVFGTTNLGSISTDLQNLFGANGLDGSKTYKDAHGIVYHYVYKYDNGAATNFLSDNRLAKPGDNLVVSVTVFKVDTPAPSNPNNAGIFA